MRRVLVTGGFGYIGSAVVRRLLQTKCRVHVLDTFARGAPVYLGVGSAHYDMNVIKGDVSCVSDVNMAMQGVECVVHLAGIVGQPACESDPERAERENVDGTRIVCSAAERWGIPVINASTCSLYAAANNGIFPVSSERSKVVAENVYTRTKYAAEQIVAGKGGISLRFGTAYGLSDNMRFDLMINEWIRDARMVGLLSVWGPHAWRPFVSLYNISTAIEGLVNMRQTPDPGAILNVADFNITKLRLAQLINAALGGEVEIVVKEDMGARGYAVKPIGGEWHEDLVTYVQTLAYQIDLGVWTPAQLCGVQSRTVGACEGGR